MRYTSLTIVCVNTVGHRTLTYKSGNPHRHTNAGLTCLAAEQSNTSEAILRTLLALQALKADKIKVLTINPAQTSTPMTWSRPDAEYLPDKMIQPDEIAEAILMTFKLNPNVFIEV